ncbi:hypothetical protein HO173_011011 [Letharia columbiana]|uniref:Uncharacterized protein n=1 Tax=Letharia columbiana TaxID=112416 RepID=A0A8H6L0D2_9LECA|nr:uncharacterized protein HO173_011011 [Letharia columbiana]KAF6230895.1 hypothetical protein HO173_011011 [Letharia columbiana]
MSGRASPSPGRRPQLNERASSSASLSKGSPNTGHLSKSHNKGSSTKLHKAHAVGHGRHPYGRVPSHGKGLHKLSKLGPGDAGEVAGHTRHHTRSASHTPTASPTTQNFKRNSSNLSLPRVGSKASIKKNKSEVSLGRNPSLTKLGNQSKGEKAQTKNSLRKKGDDDGPVKGQASFEVGNEDHENDDWTEESNSQSPHTTRHGSVGRKTPQLEDPPSPDEPAEPSPPNLPQSPPQSPPNNPSAFVDHAKEQDHHRDRSPYSHPPDADDVTHRLLNRSAHNAAPKTSNVSATVTPNGSSGSPAFVHSQDSAFGNRDSMPGDGISRFLNGTGSNSGSATPGSVSHLQQNLAHLNHTTHHDRPGSPTDSSSTVKAPTRRVKSAANLSHPRLSNGESSSASPPIPKQSNGKNPLKPPKETRVSPFESARGADPTKGKSLTQLKLDLQRMSTQRDPPSDQHPLLQHGSGFGIQNLSAGSKEMEARQARQWTQARVECANAKRFYPDLLAGSLKQQAVQSKLDGRKFDGQKKLDGKKAPDGHKGKSVKTPVGNSGEAAHGRGRVRFEVGKGSPELVEEHEEDGPMDEGVEGLLRRMWVQGETSGGEE